MESADQRLPTGVPLDDNKYPKIGCGSNAGILQQLPATFSSALLPVFAPRLRLPQMGLYSVVSNSHSFSCRLAQAGFLPGSQLMFGPPPFRQLSGTPP